MEVDFNKLKDCLDYIAQVNAADLEDIAIVKDNHFIYVPQHEIDYWRFIGLNNCDFIRRHCARELRK